MKITENVLLRDLTTFRIGGLARFFVVVKNIAELQEALVFAQSKQIPIFILGGGSNILVSDNGFAGLVIKIEITGIEIIPKDATHVEMIGGAGEIWDTFVKRAVQEGLYGIENLSLIPGSVGATPVQNIGAYGCEVKDTISWVETVHCETGEIKLFTNPECHFEYRNSYFKTEEGKKYSITRVAFLLTKEGIVNTQYKDITEYIKNNSVIDITLQKVRDIVIAIRTKKLPDVKKIGTAGSFFKNPVIKKELYEELLKIYPELPAFSTPPYPGRGLGGGEFVKIPAAWLLDKVCGFKGFREGDVGVYQNQALVLVNFGNATAQEINNLADNMIACVQEKTKIILEKEVQII